MTAEEDQARQAAEARRKRILDKANRRIDSISGLQTNDDNDDGDAAAAPRVSSAARMAAARRRRFKKKEENKTEASETTPSAATASTAAVVEEEEKEEKVVEQPAAATEVADPAPVCAASDEPPVVEAETASASTKKKKYMGVARMRRKRILEQRQQEEQNEAAAVGVAIENANNVKSKSRRRPAKLPIILHALVVVMLFCAGLEVGLQQISVDYSIGGGVSVHRDLAPRSRGPGIAKIMSSSSLLSSSGSSKSTLATPVVAESSSDSSAAAAEDEFASAEDAKVTAGELDPLFGVDLDELTAGPGLYQAACRFAVGCHRFNLSIFYYGPQRLYYRILEFFTFSVPPLLMMIALVVRHLVGKVLLGAGLPLRGKNDEQGKDILSMAMKFVKNFVGQAFPAVVTMYDMFNHLRSDMYVILAGLIVGVTWSHHMAWTNNSGGLDDVASSGDVHEEL